MPVSIPAAELQRLQKAATEPTTRRSFPRGRSTRSFIADAYLPKARASISMSELPNGKELYALLVRNRTTTDMTPEQIHEIGKREVERIQASMAAIRKELGFTARRRSLTPRYSWRPSSCSRPRRTS
jgi:uncharacterized protein (DUF885 family)